MKLMASPRLLMLVFVAIAFFVLSVPCQSAAQSAAAAETTLENIAPDQIDSTLAKLSDEQVRILLIAELQKEVVTSNEDQRPVGGMDILYFSINGRYRSSVSGEYDSVFLSGSDLLKKM